MGRFLDDSEKLIKENEEKIDENAKKKIDNATAVHDSNIQTAEREYADAERAATDDYVSAINSIDLQKALDIKDIQETRANMGLSRSGISATEQTAAVLAAGNRTNATRNQLQKTVDSLTKSLADYKIGQNQELQSTILSINEAADQSKAEYRKDVTADANEQQQTMLKALGLDSDIYAQAIEQGWDGEEALAEQVKKNNGIIDTMFVNGEITAEVRDHAKKNGYTPDQTKEHQKLVTENENEKNRVAQIEQWYQDGVIDRDVYLKYISDKTAPLSAVLLAQETKEATTRENETKANRESLKAAYNTLSEEDQKVFGSLYIEMWEKGATGEQFLATVKNRIAVSEKNTTELDTLLEAGTITKDEYDKAVKNGETASTVMQKKEKRKMLDDSFAEFKNYIKEGGTVYNVSSEAELEDLISEEESRPWWAFAEYSKSARKYDNYLATRDAVEKIVDMETDETITPVERDSLLLELGINKTTYLIILTRIEEELQEKVNEQNAVPKRTFEDATKQSAERNKSKSSKPIIMPQPLVNPTKANRERGAVVFGSDLS